LEMSKNTCAAFNLINLMMNLVQLALSQAKIELVWPKYSCECNSVGVGNLGMNLTNK